MRFTIVEHGEIQPTKLHHKIGSRPFNLGMSDAGTRQFPRWLSKSKQSAKIVRTLNLISLNFLGYSNLHWFAFAIIDMLKGTDWHDKKWQKTQQFTVVARFRNSALITYKFCKKVTTPPLACKPGIARILHQNLPWRWGHRFFSFNSQVIQGFGVSRHPQIRRYKGDIEWPKI